MNRAAHTPGPWEVRLLDMVYSKAGRLIADCECEQSRPSAPVSEDLANARLIAAAPDMLEALQNARNVLAGLIAGDLKSISADSPALTQIRAAIAKAVQS